MANTHVILCIIVLKFQTFNKEEEKVVTIYMMKSWIEVTSTNTDRKNPSGLMFRFDI